MKNVITFIKILALALAFSGVTLAGDNRVTIKVNGMVCAFCAQGIEKSFGKREEVKKVKVDLDTMQIFVDLHQGKKLQTDVAKEIITNSGFTFVSIK